MNVIAMELLREEKNKKRIWFTAFLIALSVIITTHLTERRMRK